MKRSLEIFGFILAIVIAYSSIAKANHYPGAGIGLTLGLGVLLLIFLILYAVNLSKNNKSIIPFIFGGISAFIYLFGFLCLLLHWPGGFLLTFAGLFFLLITLIVLGIVELSKKQDHRKFSIISISFIIIAASLIYAAAFRTGGRSVLDGMVSANEDLTNSTQIIYNSFNQKYDQAFLANPLGAKPYLDLRDRSNELINQIEHIKKTLATKANGSSDFSDYSQIKGLDNIDISNQVMIGTSYGVASEIKMLINNYIEFINYNDSIFHLNHKVHTLLSTQDLPSLNGERRTWENQKFLNVPVITAITNLSAIQLHIRECEMLVLMGFDE